MYLHNLNNFKQSMNPRLKQLHRWKLFRLRCKTGGGSVARSHPSFLTNTPHRLAPGHFTKLSSSLTDEGLIHLLGQPKTLQLTLTFIINNYFFKFLTPQDSLLILKHQFRFYFPIMPMLGTFLWNINVLIGGNFFNVFIPYLQVVNSCRNKIHPTCFETMCTILDEFNGTTMVIPFMSDMTKGCINT
jgi:hypothetical protein